MCQPMSTNRDNPARVTFYGLELHVRNEVIWILFGETDGQFEMGPVKVWMIDTPREEWHTVPLSVAEILAAFDIPLWTSFDDSPPRFEHVSYPRTTLHIGWLLQSTQPHSAEFGHITPQQRFPAPTTLIQDEIDHPERLLIWRGDRAFENDQFELAMGYYQQALEVSPANAQAIFGLARIEAHLQEWDVANLHLRDAERLMLSQSGAFHAGEFAELYMQRMIVSANLDDCLSARIWNQQAQFYDSDTLIRLPEMCDPEAAPNNE